MYIARPLTLKPVVRKSSQRVLAQLLYFLDFVPNMEISFQNLKEEEKIDSPTDHLLQLYRTVAREVVIKQFRIELLEQYLVRYKAKVSAWASVVRAVSCSLASFAARSFDSSA